MDKPQFNHVAWFEIGANQPKEVQNFYGKMFGWNFKANTDLPDVNYDAIIQGKDEMPTGGIFDTANKLDEYAVFYVLVEDVPATIKKAQDNGGKVIWGPVTDASNVTFARLSDNTGHQFGVFSM